MEQDFCIFFCSLEVYFSGFNVDNFSFSAVRTGSKYAENLPAIILKNKLMKFIYLFFVFYDVVLFPFRLNKFFDYLVGVKLADLSKGGVTIFQLLAPLAGIKAPNSVRGD